MCKTHSTSFKRNTSRFLFFCRLPSLIISHQLWSLAEFRWANTSDTTLGLQLPSKRRGRPGALGQQGFPKAWLRTAPPLSSKALLAGHIDPADGQRGIGRLGRRQEALRRARARGFLNRERPPRVQGRRRKIRQRPTKSMVEVGPHS